MLVGQSCVWGHWRRRPGSPCQYGPPSPQGQCTGSCWSGLQGWAGPLAPPALAAHTGCQLRTHPWSTEHRQVSDKLILSVSILTSARPIAHSLSFMKFLGSVSAWTFLVFLTYSSSAAGRIISTLSSEIIHVCEKKTWKSCQVAHLVYLQCVWLPWPQPRPTCPPWPGWQWPVWGESHSAPSLPSSLPSLV